MKKIEVKPVFDPNSTLDDLTSATMPPPVFKTKKSLEYKSGMNVLGIDTNHHRQN